MPLSEEEEDGPEEKAIHSATENKNSDNERECQSKNSDVREFKNRTKSAGKVHNKSKHSLTVNYFLFILQFHIELNLAAVDFGV